MNKKKIIVAISMAISITLITIGLILRVSTDHLKPLKQKDNLKISKNISPKKRISENIKIAKKENERLKNMEKYSNPPNNSNIDNSECKEGTLSTSEKINVNNVYTLYRKDYLNLDQFIDLENKLNLGVNELNKIKTVSNLEYYFSQNKEGLRKVFGINRFEELKSLKLNLNNISKIKSSSIQEDLINQTSKGIKFNLKIEDINKKSLSYHITVNIIDDSKINLYYRL